MDRRDALIALLAAPLVASCSGDTEDQSNATADDSDDFADYLFVQDSAGVRFDGDQMTLVNVNPWTLYFTDRPTELAGYLSYQEFMKMVTEGPDSFVDDPPNATLVILEGGTPVNVVVNLTAEPRLEGADLVFPQIRVIEGTPPATGGTSALFIDVIGRPASPGSVAGAHRRHRRRVTH